MHFVCIYTMSISEVQFSRLENVKAASQILLRWHIVHDTVGLEKIAVKSVRNLYTTINIMISYSD